MKLLIIAGFLGSGKTTLLLEVARRLVAVPQKIAIIENEVGEIGIDGKYLHQEGLQVQELFGGCICCTLSVDLVSTLEKVEKLFQPAVTIIEPTGLASPGDIVPTVRDYVAMVTAIRVLVLVDAIRHQMLSEMLSPLLAAQIQAADIAVINKIDEVNGANVDLIRKNVTQLNPQARVAAVSLEKKINLEPLLSDLDRELQ
jgi:G3E family GTPase